MCLILFGINCHPQYELILAANRDEFYKRPTTPLDYWPDNREIVSGRDLKAGGTWIGMSKLGKMAAITNFRDPDHMDPKAPSRGQITKDYLENDDSAIHFLEKLQNDQRPFNGYNLLLRDHSGYYHYSNISHQITTIENGIHGLSNHLLNTPWPKVQKGRKKLQQLIKTDHIDDHTLFNLLNDKSEASDELLPDTGVPREIEKKLSAMHIDMEGYGTRCSTVITISKKMEVHFVELTHSGTSDDDLKKIEWNIK
jgi:uncharacterized protein with NRDE domain